MSDLEQHGRWVTIRGTEIHVFCDVTKQKYDPKIENYLGFDITLHEVVSYTTRAIREGKELLRKRYKEIIE